MRLAMTKQELRQAVYAREHDGTGDALEIFPGTAAEGPYLRVDLSHWQCTIPIEVQG